MEPQQAGSMDGCGDGRMDRQLDAWLSDWTDRQGGGWVALLMIAEWMDGRTDRLICDWTDG